MKYAPKKVFILSDGEYMEISYEKLCSLKKDRRFVLLHGMLMEVSEDTYQDFYRDKRRQKYLYERQGKMEIFPTICLQRTNSMAKIF